MSKLQPFALSAWGFVVGDDWRTAIGVAMAIAATALVAAIEIAAWWVLPLAVAALLRSSLRRETRCRGVLRR